MRGCPSGMPRPRFSRHFETRSARYGGLPRSETGPVFTAFRNAFSSVGVSVGGRIPAGFHGYLKRDELPWPSHIHQPMGSWDSVSQWRFSIRAGWTVRRAETKVKRHRSQKPTSLAFDFANVNGQFAIVCANAPSQKSNGCVTEIPCRPSYGSVTSV